MDEDDEAQDISKQTFGKSKSLVGVLSTSLADWRGVFGVLSAVVGDWKNALNRWRVDRGVLGVRRGLGVRFEGLGRGVASETRKRRANLNAARP